MDANLKSEKNRVNNILDRVIGNSKPLVRARKDSQEAPKPEPTEKPLPIKEEPERAHKKEQLHQKKVVKAKKIIFKKLEVSKKSSKLTSLTPEDKTFKGETTIVAIDCEMVLCTDTQKHLARLTIVNYNRVVLIDEYVKPELPVKNYISHITNIDAFKLSHAKSYEEIKPRVEAILKGRMIIGHTIESDLGLLGIDIPLKVVRDISLFSLFMNGKYRRSLKELSEEHIGIQIQSGIHSSVEDARATLELYKMYQKEIDWETKDMIFSKDKSSVN